MAGDACMSMQLAGRGQPVTCFALAATNSYMGHTVDG
jgi:hypothetical protein